VAEAAVVVAIAAERVDDPGRRGVVEHGVEQALLQQPGLGPQKPLGGGENVIHDRDRRKPATTVS
jgi:hypothetical protein